MSILAERVRTPSLALSSRPPAEPASALRRSVCPVRYRRSARSEGRAYRAPLRPTERLGTPRLSSPRSPTRGFTARLSAVASRPLTVRVNGAGQGRLRCCPWWTERARPGRRWQATKALDRTKWRKRAASLPSRAGRVPSFVRCYRSSKRAEGFPNVAPVGPATNCSIRSSDYGRIALGESPLKTARSDERP